MLWKELGFSRACRSAPEKHRTIDEGDQGMIRTK